MHPSDLAVLKRIALAGRPNSSTDGGTDSPSGVIFAPPRNVDDRVEDLRERGLVRTADSGAGYALTDAGYEALREEFSEYRRLFGEAPLELDGAVTSGLGEGKHFVDLPGYREQFRDRLGYDPFPGTFNVSLTEASADLRGALPSLDPIDIDGWEDGDRSFGPARCHPATVRTPDGTEYRPAHVIVPERTDHDRGQIELLADVDLRATLGVVDGDPVTVAIRTADV